MRSQVLQLPGGDLRVYAANSFLSRLGGLLMRPPLQDDEALLIQPCNSVHTLGMSYPIDVVYLGSRGRVLKVVAAMKPYRFSWCWGAKAVLEVKGGKAQVLGLLAGSKVRID